MMAALLATSTAALAQSGDMVVMRRQIAKLKATGSAASTPTPTDAATIGPNDPGYYSWKVTSWQQAGACGSQGVETRSVTCTRTDGLAMADSFCTGSGSGAKPIASRPATITATCSFGWTTGDWSQPTTTCGTGTLVRDVTCKRSDGTIAPDTSCPTFDKPPATKSDTQTSSCGYYWNADQWKLPATNSCQELTETRAVYCLRTDGVTVVDDLCASAGDKPIASQPVYTCGTDAHWTTGAWGGAIAGCGNSHAYRSVDCESVSGQVLDERACTGDKPSDVEDAKSYATCTDGRTADNPYGWTTGPFGSPSTTCGAATVTRSVTCTDDSGTAVSEDRCTGTRPDATSTQTVVTGCTYAWVPGDYGAPIAACGQTDRLRPITCTRSDGTPVTDDFCQGQTRPNDSTSATDYSACTFAWAPGLYGDPSTTCGDAVQTRTVTCQRADGTAADDAQCDAASRPTATMSSHQTSGCGFDWATTAYVPTPACGDTTETRTVTCHRSDGETVDDGDCAVIGAKPPATAPTTNYSACTFDWAVGTYSGPTTTCGTVTQTRPVTCQRSDATTVDDSICARNSTKPPSSQQITDVSGCSYAWAANPWGAATPACGASTHARSYYCRRSDGSAADASLCANAGAPPSTSEATTDYSTCSYSWQVSDWQGTAGCGDTVTQNRSVVCQRSDGTPVGDSFCGTRKPDSSQPITDYSQCSYAWHQTVGTWSSTCSTTATRSNDVTCVRQDGQVMTDQSYCDASSKPATTDTGNLSGCTYTPTYGAYGACTATSAGSRNGVETAPITSCTRTDGASAATSNCSPQSMTRSCTLTYTPTYGACTATSAGSTSGSQAIASCTATGSDGTTTTVPNSYCTSTQSCTITYKPTFSGYGACSPDSYGSKTGTQTQTVTSCTAVGSDGSSTTVANSYCQSQAGTQSCSVAYTPTYGAYANCIPDKQGSTTGTESAPTASCKAPDGSTAPVASCDAAPAKQCSGITYSETYTYGTCTSGTQQGTISSCTVVASDGVTNSISTSLCPSAAQTKSNSCGRTLVCDTTPVRYGRSNTTLVASNTAATIKNLQAAFDWCVANAGTATGTNTYWNCFWNGSTTAGGGNVNVSYAPGTTPVSYNTGSGITAPASNYRCTAQ